MLENNFEKQVQQKMNNLKMNPSGEVWDKVALDIDKKKKDRKIFYVFSLLTLLLITSALWWSYRGENRIDTQKSIAAKQISTPAAKKSASAATVNSAKLQAGEDRKIPVMDNESQPSQAVPEQNHAKVTRINRSINSGQKWLRPTTLSKQETRVQASTDPTEREALETYVSAEIIPGLISPREPASNGRVSFSTVSTLKKRLLVIDTAKLRAGLPPVQNGNLSPAGKSTNSKTNDKKAFRFGLNFSGGISATRSSYLGIGNAAVSSDLQYNSPIPSNGGGTNSPVVSSHSVVTDGLGLMIGMYAHRSLTSKTSLLVSLNYKYYSTKITVGTRVDSVYNNANNTYYYRSGTTTQYNNRFHFIELPVALSFQLSKAQSIRPVYLNTGLAVSRLLNANALQLNPTNSSYYQNSVPFNKTNIDVSLQLMFSLQKRQPNALQVGPHLNYSLTKMADEGIYKGSHYSYLGIRLQKGLGRK